MKCAGCVQQFLSYNAASLSMRKRVLVSGINTFDTAAADSLALHGLPVSVQRLLPPSSFPSFKYKLQK